MQKRDDVDVERGLPHERHDHLTLSVTRLWMVWDVMKWFCSRIWGSVLVLKRFLTRTWKALVTIALVVGLEITPIAERSHGHGKYLAARATAASVWSALIAMGSGAALSNVPVTSIVDWRSHLSQTNFTISWLLGLVSAGMHTLLSAMFHNGGLDLFFQDNTFTFTTTRTIFVMFAFTSTVVKYVVVVAFYVGVVGSVWYGDGSLWLKVPLTVCTLLLPLAAAASTILSSSGTAEADTTDMGHMH